MASTASNNAASSAPPFLSLSPAQLARLQPHTYVYTHLSPSSDSSRPSVRINGRTESQFRSATVNTSSLFHANGSAVVRIGDTTAVCGIRGEILSLEDVAGCKGTDDISQTEGLENLEEDDSEIQAFNLLVPNLSLNTGCSPSILPGSAPTSLAQSLSHRLLSLLHSSRIVRASDLRILSKREQDEDTPMEGTSNSANVSEAPEVKAFWTLYIDVLIISLAGSPFDAAWAAIMAALRDTRLPRAWWDEDSETVLCSDRMSEATKLQLRGMPISSTFGVFEADPLSDWRKIIMDRGIKSDKKAEINHDDQHCPKKSHWVLADPDAFEEALCQEQVCIMVDKDETKPNSMHILMIEKKGGFYVGKDKLRGLVDLATERWREWQGLLQDLG